MNASRYTCTTLSFSTLKIDDLIKSEKQPKPQKLNQ